MAVALYPSLMCADPLRLGAVVADLEPAYAGFHVDLMDNTFVPNLQGSVDLVNALAAHTKKPLWIHCMIAHPARLIKRMRLRSSDIMSIHAEIDQVELAACIKQIKTQNARASIAISPQTAVERGLQLTHEHGVDHLLIMSVQPGFAGQQFLPTTYERIHEVRERNKKIAIGIDGGLTSEILKKLETMGVDDIALGSMIF